jgi:nicotinate-nucleotide adenylyltransferase
MRNHPIGILARPGEQLRAGLSPAARAFASRRLPQGAARRLGYGDTPRWVLLTGPMSPLSSTAIRNRGEWP